MLPSTTRRIKFDSNLDKGGQSHLLVKGVPVIDFLADSVGRGVVVELHELWEVMCHYLRRQNRASRRADYSCDRDISTNSVLCRKPERWRNPRDEEGSDGKLKHCITGCIIKVTGQLSNKLTESRILGLKEAVHARGHILLHPAMERLCSIHL